MAKQAQTYPKKLHQHCFFIWFILPIFNLFDHCGSVKLQTLIFCNHILR